MDDHTVVFAVFLSRHLTPLYISLFIPPLIILSISLSPNIFTRPSLTALMLVCITVQHWLELSALAEQHLSRWSVECLYNSLLCWHEATRNMEGREPNWVQNTAKQHKSRKEDQARHKMERKEQVEEAAERRAGEREGRGREEGWGGKEGRQREGKWKSKRRGQKCLARPFYFETNAQCSGHSITQNSVLSVIQQLPDLAAFLRKHSYTLCSYLYFSPNAFSNRYRINSLCEKKTFCAIKRLLASKSVYKNTWHKDIYIYIYILWQRIQALFTVLLISLINVTGHHTNMKLFAFPFNTFNTSGLWWS